MSGATVTHRVLLTVSGTMTGELEAEVASGRRPRVDYLEMAKAFGADLLDYRRAAETQSPVGRVVQRFLGGNAGLAWRCFSLRDRYDVIMTDGEQVGLPFAALSLLSGRRRPRHLMIVHILSVPKKVALYRTLRLGRRIDEMIVYAAAQKRFVVDRLHFPAEQVTLSPFMVDTAFFAPDRVQSANAESVGSAGRATIAAAGLEFRDYPTMLEAVRGLDARVVLAAASPWSKRASDLDGVHLPPNVEVVRLDLHQLRQLYAEASIVVMPLRESDFQAGVTTLLEAMSMAKPIVCSATTGQTDVIAADRTGRYVPVGDAEAMRSAITELLGDPATSERMGIAARDWVVSSADIDVYVRLLATRVDHHRARHGAIDDAAASPRSP